MGSEYEQHAVRAKDEKELLAVFHRIVGECQYEDGHGGYTGTFAEKSSMKVLDKEFATSKEAEDYLSESEETCDKWGPAYAVKITTPAGETQKWVIGGWCSS